MSISPTTSTPSIQREDLEMGRSVSETSSRSTSSVRSSIQSLDDAQETGPVPLQNTAQSIDDQIGILQSYLTADSDEAALGQLATISGDSLAEILTFIFNEGNLQPVPMRDAAQIFMLSSPRNELVKRAVEQRLTTLRNTQEASTLQNQSKGFFGVMKVVFLRISIFVQDLFRWICSLFSGPSRPSDDDNGQSELLDALRNFQAVINNPGADNEILRLNTDFISLGDDVKTRLCYLIYEEAQKAQQDVSDRDFGSKYLAENPAGEFTKKAVERFIAELSS